MRKGCSTTAEVETSKILSGNVKTCMFYSLLNLTTCKLLRQHTWIPSQPEIK